LYDRIFSKKRAWTNLLPTTVSIALNTDFISAQVLYDRNSPESMTGKAPKRSLKTKNIIEFQA
jgi:hypothetical protein